MRMYCITLDNNHYEKIKRLDYIPVGLGDKIFSKKFESDKRGDNISLKNPFYGEYSFHYWLWKNEIMKIPDGNWIGFCTYRRFWKSSTNRDMEYKEFSKKVIQEIPKEWDNYETILGDHIKLEFKLMKILKYGKKALINNPKAIFSKKSRNIRYHFDIFH